MSIENVLEAFIYHDKRASTPNGSLSTDNAKLIGYGRALYAEHKEGELIVYNGWYGYSPTTSRHINKLTTNLLMNNVKFREVEEKPEI